MDGDNLGKLRIIPDRPQRLEWSVVECHPFRLETRAKELTVMASLNLNRVEAKGNRISAASARESV